MYRVHLLDKDRNLVAVLDQVASWRYSRRASEATPFIVAIPRHWVEVMVPRESALWAFLNPGFYAVRERRQEPEPEQPNKVGHAQIASCLQLWRGDKLILTGRISNRLLKDDVVELQCHTEEILLESHVTPAQYSRVIDGLDIGDLARMMLQGWHTVRVKTRTQWNAAIEKLNVDTDTEPGLVLLAKDGEGRYHEQGHIVLRFRKSQIPDFAQWDRIRWLSDNGAPVRTTMQYRYGPDEFSLTPWSEEFEGALPDTLGVVPAAFAEEILDVRINLYTDDTESPDFEDNPVGQTPAVFAVEVIARTAGRVTEGGIPTNTGVIVRNVEADNTPALKILQDAVEQAGWEFVVHDGKLYLGEELGQDRRNDFVLRAGTSMQIESLGDVDEEMVNILTAYGPGDGINRMQVVLRDEASIAAYGPYPKSKEFPGAVDMLDLQQQAQEWLDEHKSPMNAFSVMAVFPPDEEPEYSLGDMVRVVDPQSGLIVDTRIMGEERSFGSDGIKVRLDLGRSAKGIAQAVLKEAGLDEPVTPTGLMPPVGLRAFTARPGVRVLVNPYASSRAEGVEIHGSTTPGFTPSTWTLLARGQETRFYFNHLTRGVRWYFKARSYGGGQYSDWTPEVSAVSGVIGGGDIGERVIQEINIALEAITEDLIAARAVSGEKIKEEALEVAHFAKGIRPIEIVDELPELPDERYPEGSTVYLAPESKVYTTDGLTWSTFEIGPGSITETEIADDAITTPKLAANAVTAAKIAAQAIQAAHIAANAVQAGHVAAGAIGTDQLAANAVTAAKIAAGQILAEHLASGSVTTEKILAQAIIGAHIGAGQITTEHLAARAVTAEKIRAVDAALSTITAGDRTLMDGLGLSTWGLTDEVDTFVTPFMPARARKVEIVSRVGNLSGLPWKGVPLPPGTYGVWAKSGYFSGELLTVLGLQNQVLDGTVIDLSDFGWRHSYELVVTPVEFIANWSGAPRMFVRAYGEKISENKFRVRCLAFAPGAAVSAGPSSRSTLKSTGNTTSIVFPPREANVTSVKARGFMENRTRASSNRTEAVIEIADIDANNNVIGPWREIYRHSLSFKSFGWNSATFDSPTVATGGKRVGVRMRCTKGHGSGEAMQLQSVTFYGDQYYNRNGQVHNPLLSSSGFFVAYVVKEAEG